MILDDDELRDIFKTASEEHLQKLDEGLLHLEKYPNDQAKLEELLREAHSLKGDAGMLGVKDVATLAHQMEHILGGVKRGETPLTPTISDRLYCGLDAIRQLVQEAVTGEPPQVNTFYILAYMMGSQTLPPANNKATQAQVEDEAAENEDLAPPQAPETLQTAENEDIAIAPLQAPETVQIEPQPIVQEQENGKVTEDENLIVAEIRHSLPPTPSPHPTPHTPLTTTSRFAIESVRVETRHLDSLMTQAGELTVTKTRIAHRLIEIEEIVNLCEEWSRETSVNRFLFQEINSPGISSPTNGKNSPLSFDYSGGIKVGERTQDAALKQWQHWQHRVQEKLDLLSSLINRFHNAIYEDNARLEVVADELSDGIRTLRLLPLSTIFNLFPRMVRDLAMREGKQIDFLVEGGETKADKRILEEMKDPLMHMIRNAIDHGIETPEERQKIGKTPQAKIKLRATQTATNVVIEVIDDGRGLDLEKIKQTAIKRGISREEELATMTPSQIQSLIFEPGFSTRTFVTEVSGRGVGLDVVRTNVELLKGTIQIESKPGLGCAIRLQLPTTLATAHVLIIVIAEIRYAIPVEFVQMARFLSHKEIFTIEGKDTMVLDNQPISVARLADLLELPLVNSNLIEPPAHSWQPNLHNSNSLADRSESAIPCLILKVGDERLGLLVDALVDEQDVMLKAQSQLLKRVRNVSGATILGNGEVCMVLNPQDLIKSVRKQSGSLAAKPITQSPSRKQVILLVEDSISTRTQEKRILESAGYEVVTAVDGLDGFNKLKTRSFDAVVSDIQMPNLDGLALTAKIRQLKEYSELPIILVTSLSSEEDKRRGAETGANAYITKGTFSQEVLLDTLRRIV